MKEWRYFKGEGKADGKANIEKFPDSPPWRQFRNIEKMDEKEKKEIKDRWEAIKKLADSEENERGKKKGENFRIHIATQQDGTEEGTEVVDAVNAALYLRRPLLVTGNPGSGKTSLAYAIAYELNLGPVLTWPITARSTLQDGLYRYDAIGRLQDDKEKKDIGEYIQLGPVGTAFLPSQLPRVLLIDEIDKSDINLPNDLLHLFEEGKFEIPELVRRAKDSQAKEEDGDATSVEVRTEDPGIKASIDRGRIRCAEFPMVVMTSNGEREFPPAFLRRCLRVKMPDPQSEALKTIVKAHFGDKDFEKNQTHLTKLIDEFLTESDRSTDQLLNTIYLLTKHVSPEGADAVSLKALLLKPLSTTDEL